MPNMNPWLAALSASSALITPALAAPDPDWSFDLGGELRERYESSSNPLFGMEQPVQNDYLLQRALLAGEVRRGNEFLAHVELVSGLASGWTGSPPPIQEDSLDVLQAYVETSWPLANSRLDVRAGRQELILGSSRLVSIRESPNIRRAFDGLRATWRKGEHLGVTAFFVRPVSPDSGAFDDRSSSRQRFWGIYATRPLADELAVDAYYLGLDRAQAEFAQGGARERRHSLGARLFGRHAAWDWNIEGVWQWGSFGENRVRAWTLSLDAGFEFSAWPLSPRIGLKADAISGDRNPFDTELNTFNPLFPKLPYFSEANLATPANLLDLQPNLRLALSKKLEWNLSWNGLWKHEKADAYYAPPLSPVPGTSMTHSRAIGWQASTSIEWQPREKLTLYSTYVWFEPREVTREIGGRQGSFLAASIDWKF